jgi:hypothetical protein
MLIEQWHYVVTKNGPQRATARVCYVGEYDALSTIGQILYLLSPSSSLMLYERRDIGALIGRLRWRSLIRDRSFGRGLSLASWSRSLSAASASRL